MKAYLKQVRISSKKMNLVAKLVRGKKATDAMTLLKFIPKRSAPILGKLIASAVANAEHNFKQKADGLTISKIIVNEGQTMKRGRPVSRGRWHPVLKRTSKVSLELEAAAPAKKTTKKAAAKTEEKPAAEKKEAPKKETAEKKAPAKKAPAKKDAPKKEDKN